MARLTVFRGPPTPECEIFAWRLPTGRSRIGRTDDCDIVLPDEAVSRSHCIVDVDDVSVQLIDRSTNGTFVNGERTKRASLNEQDVVKIGPFSLRFDATLAEAQSTEEPQAEPRHEEIVDSQDALAVSEAWLVVVEGPAEGKRVRLRGGRIGVGGAGSKVVLADPALAVDHVRIRLLGGRTMVEPGIGAAFVEDVRLRDIMPLYEGERVRVGGTLFRVEWQTTVDHPSAQRFGEMVGNSKEMRGAFGLLRRMAAHHASILLIGESGTGKELAARGIHDASPRAGNKFVAVNCGAITPTLFESELFGHEKGSFTGANERRDGAFQRADGGTLFLDEIGELPEDAQAKLLRALETGEVRRVGGAEAGFPDARIIAATNRALHDEVKAGRFRADLYFRLAVLTVRLPPLRERPEDIPVMANAIAQRIHPSMSISPAALSALCAYPWPGNAREMRNVLTRSYVLFGSRVEPASLIFSPLDESQVASPVVRNLVDETERDVVLDAMRKARQNRSEAARILGIPRSSLLYKLRRWNIE